MHSSRQMANDCYQNSNHYPVIFLIVLYIVYFIFIFNAMLTASAVTTISSLRDSHDCIVDVVRDMDPYELWLKFPGIVNSCSKMRLLDFKGYSNLDETKYHVMRKDKTVDCTVVTLGIGRDVAVELQLKKDDPECKFFGADPVEETNRRIYGKFGTFYHTAVGAKSGNFNAALLETNSWDYKNQTTRFRNFFSFLRDDVKQTVIDQLMVDIEYAEYDLLPHFLSANRPQDMIFCQINIEIHMGPANRRKEFSTFLNSLLDEGEFVPLKAGTMLGHLRLYLLNVSDPTCRRRYLEKPKEE